MFRRRLRAAYRLHSHRIRRFVLHQVLHADDPPHRLALGAAIGMFVMLTPTLGVQMIIVVFLAWLLRANKVVGLPIVWISNPATAVPIYYSCYWLGRTLLNRPRIARSWWAELAQPPEEWADAITFYWDKFTDVAAPLWTGCIIVGLAAGYLTYVVVYRVVVAYRMRRWGQLLPPAPSLILRESRRAVRASGRLRENRSLGG